MLTIESLDELANKLSQVLPDSFKETQKDLKNNFKLILQSSFAKLNLVTREEFDKQSALLHKAREKLALLEKKLDQL